MHALIHKIAFNRFHADLARKNLQVFLLEYAQNFHSVEKGRRLNSDHVKFY